MQLLAVPDREEQLWAIDVHVGLERVACSFLMFSCLVGGEVDLFLGKYFAGFSEEDFELGEEYYEDRITNIISATNPVAVRSIEAPFPLLTDAPSREVSRRFEDFNKYAERCFAYIFHAEHSEVTCFNVADLMKSFRLKNLVYSIDSRNGPVFSIHGRAAGIGVMGIGQDRLESIKALSKVFSFFLQVGGPPPPVALQYTGKEAECNLPQIVAKLKQLYMQLDRRTNKWRRIFLDL